MRVSFGLALSWLIVFGVCFFAAPLGALVVASGAQSGAVMAAAFFSPVTLEAVRFTVIESLASVALSIALGLPLGFAVARLEPRARAQIERILALPLLIPTVSAGAAWTMVIAQFGTSLGLGFGLTAIVMAHTAFNAPWIAWCVSRALSQEGLGGYDLARSLGASRRVAYRAALAGRVRPALGEAALQAFAWSAMSFAVVMALGGGPPLETLEVSLYSSVRFGSIERIDAIAVALWQLVIVMGAWALGRLFAASGGSLATPLMGSAPLRRGEGVSTPRWRRVLWVCALLPLTPYVWALFGAEVVGGGGSTLESPLAASGSWGLWIIHSLMLGTFGALFAVMTALAWIVVQNPWQGRLQVVRLCAQIPAGVSPLTLGFGIWLIPWFNFAVGSVWTTALVISGILGVLFSPFAYRILQPVADRLRTHEHWAARSLGATPAESFWWVEFRAWVRPVSSAFALAFGASVGEVSVVMFFSHPDFVTLPAAASRLLGQYHFAAAQAVAVVILLLGVGAYVLAELLQRSSPGVARG